MPIYFMIAGTGADHNLGPMNSTQESNISGWDQFTWAITPISQDMHQQAARIELDPEPDISNDLWMS